MEREYRADVACWAKNLLKIPVLTFHSALFFTTAANFLTTGGIKDCSEQCEIPATIL
jgi:hypothetical protein